MADGLLNKASIILTPTGYKAGTLYNVAPIDEPYEDFDFARASVASRVNSSGLVEMVGRTLSSELVTNGDFDTDSNWSKQTGWSISNGKAISDGSGNYKSISQSCLVSPIGKTYKVTYEVSDYVIGEVRCILGGFTLGQIISSNGLVTEYLTVSNASSNTFVYLETRGSGFTGSIDNVSVKEIIDTNNIPRISYDSNGDNGHILLEPTSTNLLPYSEDFSKWASSNATLESGFLAPDGSNSAYKVSGTVGSTTVYFSGVPNLSSTSTRTIWAKTVSGTGTINLCSYGNNSNNNFTITEEWQRFEVNGTTTSTGESNFYAADFRFNQPNALTEIIIWGAQAENLSYATSYIPTLTGSTETRATETATGAGSAELINSTEGVLYAEIAALADSGTNRYIGLSDGTSSNRVNIFFDSNNILKAFVSGISSITSSATITDMNKIAFKYKSGDIALWVNGVEVGTSSSSISLVGLDELSFSLFESSSLVFNGKCKALAVFNEALSDDELNNLTG